MERYYTEQLALLREGTRTFARKYPAIAPMLLQQSGDPDVERILEGTAYLCGKIHERLDQTAPDLVQSLLRLVFPQAILPVPSATLMRFALSPGFTEPLDAPQGTQIASNPVDGVPCIYSTVHDLRILPLSVSAVRCENPSATSLNVQLTLSSPAPLRAFLTNELDLHLTGAYAVASQRFLALLTRLTGLTVISGKSRFSLAPEQVRQRSLPLHDLRLPDDRRSNRAYMELIRYFLFPEHLLGIRIAGFDRLALPEDARSLTLAFQLEAGEEPLPSFSDDAFGTNIVPAVNVFRTDSDPLVIDHTQEEYRIRPQDGARRFLEVLNIATITALLPGGRTIPCLPYETYDNTTKGLLYSLRYRQADKDVAEHLLTPLYRFAAGEDMLERCTLSLELLCCNHTLPNSLRAGDVCRPTDSSPAQATFSNITAPTPMMPRPYAEDMQWRFLSHLNANLLSLASPDALRSLLELYLPESAAAPELAAANIRRCQSIKAFSSYGEERLFSGRLLRGRKLNLTLDPAGFVSRGDMYLFGSALDRFFTEFTNLNNYSRLHLDITGSKGNWQWPPRLGEKRLI